MSKENIQEAVFQEWYKKTYPADLPTGGVYRPLFEIICREAFNGGVSSFQTIKIKHEDEFSKC